VKKLEVVLVLVAAVN